MKTAYETKQEELGTNDENLASKKSQLAEAKEQKASDEEFLAKLLVMCAEKAKQYDERKMLRANEEAAIAEAIAVLNSDAAFESFGKVTATKTGSTGPTLLQLGAIRRHASAEAAQAALRAQVTEILRTAAVRQKSMRLAKVASLLKAGNPFAV